MAFGASGMMGGGRPGGMGGMGGGRFTEDGTSTDPRGNRGEMTGDATMERPTWDAQQDATQTAQAPDAVVENDTATSVNISAGNTLEIQDSNGSQKRQSCVFVRRQLGGRRNLYPPDRRSRSSDCYCGNGQR